VGGEEEEEGEEQDINEREEEVNERKIEWTQPPSEESKDAVVCSSWKDPRSPPVEENRKTI
jgi:hypothetical protein